MPVVRIAPWLAALSLASLSPAQSRLTDLKLQLDAITQNTQGMVAYSLHHRKTDDRLDKLGDEPFPTDSTLKVAIMCAAMEPVVSGKVGYHDTRQLIPEDKNAGGFFFSYKDGTEIEFSELVHQMIAVSDNTATLMLMRWIGGAGPVNAWLQRHGLKKTRLIAQYPVPDELANNAAKVEELKSEFARWGMGVSTPNEMRELMEMIVDGRAGSAAAVDEMWRVLTHQYKDSGIATQIPPWISVAAKSGRGPRSRSDMAIVNSPSGIYVLTIFAHAGSSVPNGWHDTVNNSIRGISKTVWQHYHPADKWSPPADAGKFW
jgi:beta-lactamase class A